MIQQAIESDDPVLFYEPKRRYWDKGEVDESAAPRELLKAQVCREGTDATLVAYGPMVKTCLQAAEAAAAEGKNLEVIDLRTLSPLDLDTVAASVEKTGRIVVVHEASTFLGLGAEIAAAAAAALLLPPRGAGAPGRRLQPALPAEQARGGVPPRPRPGARRRRPLAGLLRGTRKPHGSQGVQAPRPR